MPTASSASYLLRAALPAIDAGDVFVSGLFVWRSIERKGAAGFLANRAVRLGVPFVVGMLVLMPLTYYAVFRLTTVIRASRALSKRGLRCRSGRRARCGVCGFCSHSTSPRWRSSGCGRTGWMLCSLGRLCPAHADDLLRRARRRFAPAVFAARPHLHAMGLARARAAFVAAAARAAICAVFLRRRFGGGRRSRQRSSPRRRQHQAACAALGHRRARVLRRGLGAMGVITQRGPAPIVQFLADIVVVLYAATALSRAARLRPQIHPSRAAAARRDRLERIRRLFVYFFVLWTQYLLLGVNLSAVLKVVAVFAVSLSLSWIASGLLCMPLRGSAAVSCAESGGCAPSSRAPPNNSIGLQPRPSPHADAGSSRRIRRTPLDFRLTGTYNLGRPVTTTPLWKDARYQEQTRAASRYAVTRERMFMEVCTMNGSDHLIGLIVVILAILSFFGLR